MTTSVLRIGLMGDVFPADLPNSLGIGVGSRFSQSNQDDWIKHFRQYTGNNDLNFCNLEAPLILEVNETLRAPFAGYVDFGSFLQRSNIGVVSIANNHILEHGTESFRKTIDILDENDVRYIGRDQGHGPNITFLDVDGLRLAFTGFSDVHGIQRIAGTYATYSEEQVLATTREMREKGADYIFISLHWGDEYCDIPHIDQIEAAHRFIDNGANVIIGHHPHVIQPVERYRNGLVFYSLGNFLFDMIWSKEVRSGMFVTLYLSPNLGVDYHIRPTLLASDFRPVELREKLSLASFWKSMRRHSKLMTNLQNDREAYSRYYKRHRKRNQLYQRIKMKEYLLLRFHRLPSHLRRQILRTWYLKLVGNRG